MTKFKLYEDILSRSWNRYFYDVEANTIEEAVEKVRYEEVDLISKALMERSKVFLTINAKKLGESIKDITIMTANKINT